MYVHICSVTALRKMPLQHNVGSTQQVWCACACMYVYVCVSVCLYIYIYMHMCVCVYTYVMHVCAYIFRYCSPFNTTLAVHNRSEHKCSISSIEYFKHTCIHTFWAIQLDSMHVGYHILLQLHTLNIQAYIYTCIHTYRSGYPAWIRACWLSRTASIAYFKHTCIHT